MHVMKLIFIIYCIGLFWSLLYSSVSWADTKSADYGPSKLPGSSIHLVSRLAEFEIREKQKLEQVLNSKRKEVLVILRKHFKQSTKLTIFTDSVYVKEGISSWLNNWKARGWKTASKKPVLGASGLGRHPGDHLDQFVVWRARRRDLLCTG